jgi:biopolymer transport protein ExbB/TolQ
MAYGDGYKADSQILGVIIVLFLIFSSLGMLTFDRNSSEAKQQAAQPDPLVQVAQAALKSDDPKQVASALVQLQAACKERAAALKKQVDHYSSDYRPLVEEAFKSLERAQSNADALARHLEELQQAK